jgi:hypothetical protein
MSVLADRSDKIVVTVTPAQARHIATAIRLDLATRWEQEWLHPLARREEINSARSLLDVCADELEMLRWGEPAGDVALRSERRRLGELAQNLLDGGEECFACRDDAPAVRRQGEDMLSAALVILAALSDA